MATIAKKRTTKPEVFMLRVDKGCFIPADGYTSSRLRARNYKAGDLVGCVFKKLNNPKFHRLIHRIGQLCAENIDAFHGMEAHDVLKRIQIEGNIECDEVAISMRSAWMQFSNAILANTSMQSIEPALRVVGAMLPDNALMFARFPRSLSFDSMDDGQRHEVARGMCRHIAAKYWQGMDADTIEEMAESFVGEAA